MPPEKDDGVPLSLMTQAKGHRFENVLKESGSVHELTPPLMLGHWRYFNDNDDEEDSEIRLIQ